MTKIDKAARISKLLDEAEALKHQNSKIGVRFYERSDQSFGSKSVIYVSVTFKGRTSRRSTGIECTVNTFNSDTLTIENDSVSSTFIQKLNALVKETITEFRITDRTIDPSKILQVVFLQTTLHDSTPNFSEILDYIALTSKKSEQLKEITEKTLKRTLLCIERLNEYHLKRFKTKQIRLSKYTVSDAKDFIQWLKLQYAVSNATIRKHLQVARKAFAIALENRWHDFNPYMYAMASEKTGVNIDNYLTEPELKALRELTFLNNQIYEEIRDAFVFQCLTGLSFADLKQLRPEHIKRIGESPVIVIQRKKTGKPSTIPLFQLSLEYLDKFREANKGTFCIPSYSQTHHNRVLKELAMLANIDKNLTTHTARRTFGNLMLANGLSKESLQSIYGHSSIKITERHYSNTSVERSIEEMKTVTSKLHNL